MIQDIYKTMRGVGFSSKNQDVVNNKRLGIRRTFTDDLGRYTEIYKEEFGFSVIIYGDGFMTRYYPTRFDIINRNDVRDMEKRIKNIINPKTN